MSTSITTTDYIGPGSLVVLDGAEWLRVTATTGAGPFTSTVVRIGAWERRWIRARETARRIRYAWQRHIWWPAVDWVADQREARRQR